jgi:energy-converting hydrogenase A subunit R
VNGAFITDCEGPISKNDNAYETTSHFVKGGKKLFTVISRYDDVVADILHRPGYKAGETVKLVLPFLKACGATDRKMQEYSRKNLILIAHAKETLQYIQNHAESFIVSTSYEHYIHVMCDALGFPCKNAYCTQFSLKNYALPLSEKNRLMEIAAEIETMPLFEISPDACSLPSLPPSTMNCIKRLDEIFKEVKSMEIGRIYNDVITMGGSEKAEAVKDASRRAGTDLHNVMYVGDSITDVQAFRLIRQRGGLATSFNGNRYAVENTEIAVLSESSLVTAVLADVFLRKGKAEALRFAENWSRETLLKSSVDSKILRRFFEVFPHRLPKVEKVTGQNMKSLIEASSRFRKKVRGEAIGKLG